MVISKIRYLKVNYPSSSNTCVSKSNFSIFFFLDAENFQKFKLNFIFLRYLPHFIIIQTTTNQIHVRRSQLKHDIQLIKNYTDVVHVKFREPFCTWYLSARDTI